MPSSHDQRLDLRIVDYRPDHVTAFDRLNRRWLDAFALTEPADEADLADPDAAFLAEDGAIFVAESGTVAIGVCGVRRCGDDAFEIAKLAVDPSAQRQGIGRLLVHRCIYEARTRGAARVVLVSSSLLTSALALYESMGFLRAPIPPEFAGIYETADVFMTLELNEPEAITTARTLLATTPATLNAWLRDLPAHLRTANEGENTWSPFDVVGHLIHGEKTDWMARMQMILTHGEERAFEPFDRFAQQKASVGRTLPELLDEFATLRAANLEALAGLRLTEADLSRRGRHPALGSVTLRQLLSTWVAHDLDHIVQIARVLAYQYRDEVGPWRAYLRVVSGAPSQ